MPILMEPNGDRTIEVTDLSEENRLRAAGYRDAPADADPATANDPADADAPAESGQPVGDHADEAAAAESAAADGDSGSASQPAPDGQRVTDPDVPDRVTEDEAAFDPSEHKVAEVQQYLADHPDDADRVLDLERNGQNRVTITGDRADD
jgi:hypothetical protein